MPDDLSNRGAQDRARINLSKPHEVKYWTQKWSISEHLAPKAVICHVRLRPVADVQSPAL